MIGFRVDANEHIASGHLMRCLSIAEECIQNGEEVIFIMADRINVSMEEKLVNKHIPYIILDSDWTRLDNELSLLAKVIEQKNLSWLVVDSYYATATYLKALECYTRVLYIDDLNKEKYEISSLLRYSQWPDDRSYIDKYRNSDISLLVGMKYTPLRKEFAVGRSIKLQDRENAILITTGGTDICNVTGKLLEMLGNYRDFSGYHKYVIVGGMNAFEIELNRIAAQDSTVSIHKNVSNIDEYMRKCKYAVSAGGTTLYELCACQTPTVCFSFADNQLDFARAMGERRIMMFAGDAREDRYTCEGVVCKMSDYMGDKVMPDSIEHRIISGLALFKNNPEIARTYAQRMGRLVDGKGAKRIADFLNLDEGRKLH